jgi:quinol monooxygenase YgiN
MPRKYVAEMFCDRIAACKIYLVDKYTDAAAYDYYMRAKTWTLIHPETGAELEEMLRILKDEGEDAAFVHVRKYLKEGK